MSASVGTMVAAALETAGYRAQEYVLTDFIKVVDSTTMLLFTASIIGGIVTIGLQGHYKVAVWFFVGPALFFFVTRSRVESDGSMQKLGAYEGSVEEVRKIAGTEGQTFKVAMVFEVYNRMISNVVQEVARVITDNKIRKQLIFMTRQGILDRLMGAKVSNAGLQ
jgi:hypothetical protein